MKKKIYDSLTHWLTHWERTWNQEMLAHLKKTMENVLLVIYNCFGKIIFRFPLTPQSCDETFENSAKENTRGRYYDNFEICFQVPSYENICTQPRLRETRVKTLNLFLGLSLLTVLGKMLRLVEEDADFSRFGDFVLTSTYYSYKSWWIVDKISY